MGSVCCCLSCDDVEDYVNPNNPAYRNDMCLSCLVQNLLNACASIFRRGEALSISSSLQRTTSMTSSASLDNSLSDIYRSPPRPLPYDAKPLNSAEKWNECAREDELKIYRSKRIKATSEDSSQAAVKRKITKNQREFEFEVSVLGIIQHKKYRVSRAWDESTDLETVNTQQVHSSTSKNAMNLSSDVHGLPEASVSDTEIKPNDLPTHNGFEHVHVADLKPADFECYLQLENTKDLSPIAQPDHTNGNIRFAHYYKVVEQECKNVSFINNLNFKNIVGLRGLNFKCFSDEVYACIEESSLSALSKMIQAFVDMYGHSFPEGFMSWQDIYKYYILSLLSALEAKATIDFSSRTPKGIWQ
ncbi:hypothetical protein KIW84_030023 [Lathyrus oleraceus]|uniref:Uncharacterized protein n=1 Tax=Pisum sativum TaxID=3888 RepID=A0A9D4XLU3_PEA|nr:hypothetical protein KIW84_030023 [Pisum sativum]